MKEEYLALPVLAMLSTSPASVKIGSGFYYRTDKCFYFITARHLLFEKKVDVLLGSDLQLLSYGLDILTDPKKRVYKVDVHALHLEKSILVADVDVAVLRLGSYQERNDQEGLALIESAEKAENEQNKKEGGEERRDEEGSGDAEKVDDEREHNDWDCGLSDGNVPVIQRPEDPR